MNLVQSLNGTTTATTGSCSAAFPSPNQAGDLLIVGYLSYNPVQRIGDSAGNKYIQAGTWKSTAGAWINVYLSLWYCLACVRSQQNFITSDAEDWGNNNVMLLAEFSPTNGYVFSLLDQSTVGATSATPTTTPAIATANARDLLFSLLLTDNNTAPTPGAGYTALPNTGTAELGLIAQYQIVTSTGSYTASGSSTSADCNLILAAFGETLYTAPATGGLTPSGSVVLGSGTLSSSANVVTPNAVLDGNAWTWPTFNFPQTLLAQPGVIGNAPGAQTVTVPFGSNVTAGNGILVSIVYATANGVPAPTTSRSDPLTLLFTDPGNISGYTITMYLAPSAVGGSTSVIWVAGSGGGSIVINELSPPSGSTFTTTLDGSGQHIDGGAALPAITTTQNGSVILLAGWCTSTVTALAASPGFSIDFFGKGSGTNPQFQGHGQTFASGTFGPLVDSAGSATNQFIGVAVKLGAALTLSTAYVGFDAGVAVAATSMLYSPVGGSEDNSLSVQLFGSNTAVGSGGTSLFNIASRPTTGTLLNSYSLSGAAFRYYWLQSPGTALAAFADMEVYAPYVGGLNATAAPVTITPPGGYNDVNTRVRLSCATTNVNIYYTTDGSHPLYSPTTIQYLSPFILTGSATIKAVAVGLNLTASRVTQALFHIGSVTTKDLPYEVSRNGYRQWCVAGKISFDPNTNAWYFVGANMDLPGINAQFAGTGQGGPGLNIYKSSDLRNWTFVASALTGLYANGTSNNGGQNGTQGTFFRAKIVWNALNSNYVLWATGTNSSVVNFCVFTSSSISGPWTLQNTYTNINGNGIGDFDVFIDGTTGYLITGAIAVPNVTVCTLATSFSAITATMSTYNSTTVFGNASEAFSMVKVGTTYFLQESFPFGWQPELNLYVSAATPNPATWSATTDPFQAVGGGLPLNTVAFSTQTGALVPITGRTSNILYMGDSYGVDHNAIQSQNVYATFLLWTPYFLPVATTSGMSISWFTTWVWDTQMVPSGTGVPAAATALTLTHPGSTVVATWTNNAVGAYSLYLDRATNAGFTTGVVSEVLAQGTSSFTDNQVSAGTTYFYRVRAVNASGSTVSTSQSISTPAPPVSVGGFPWVLLLGH